MEAADRRVRELMAQLDSVTGAEKAAAHLVACGRAAIEPLRRFLLESPPRALPQPRCWAVRALAGLGAKDVLLAYLAKGELAEDRVVRLAEEAVQRAAAVALAAWRTDEVFDRLRALAVQHRSPGLVEALGAFERREAVPILIEALEDDFCRPWAEAALARTADRDRDALIASAFEAHPALEHEAESSRRRRRAVLGLLRALRPSPGERRRLAALIDEPDVEMAVDASAIVIEGGEDADAQRARRRLWALAPAVPWHLHRDVQQLLRTPARERRLRGR